MRKILSLTLCICLIFSSVSHASASMENKLKDVKSKSSTVNKEIKQKQSEVAAISRQIEEIEGKITDSENKIMEMEAQILAYTNSIKLAEEEVERLGEKIVVNTGLLGERINVMYKKGDIAYMEILFKSRSFNELLSNFNVIKKIVDYDRQLLTELEDVKDTIGRRKVEMEESRKAIANLKELMEIEKARLEENETQQQAAKALISDDIKKLQIQEDELLKQAKSLEKEIKALAAKSSMGATYKGGVMGWPLAVTGKITSPFGYRKDPFSGTSRMHTGLDIAAPKGTNVLAAADGEVIASRYAGSYGNMIMIDHGGGIVTLYAHNSALVVGVGTKVKRGTVIAKVGSTGASTGNHSHFEVRVNGKFVDPRKYV